MNATSRLLDVAAPMNAGPALGAAAMPDGEGEGFFSSYEWCLNPLQTFAALCARAHEELARCHSLDVIWQREESRTNLYLLLCAACCTIDDYLMHRPWDLSAAVRRLPRMGACIRVAQGVLNAAPTLRRLLVDERARRLRKQLAHCVDLICKILVDRGEGHSRTWTSLAAAMREASCIGLPSELLAWRARIPEAFRCQDMSHFDALAMARRFLLAETDNSRPVLVVGLRTAGAYFAPLVRAALAARGFPVLGWITIRPKLGMSRRERRHLQRVAAGESRVLVVDDHPNTGGTFARTLELLNRMGIASDRVVFVAPEHPAQLDWMRQVGDAKCVILPFGELYKQQLLQDDATIADILCDLFRRHGWTEVYLQTSPQLDRLNAEQAARLLDTFEVRLKRVWRVQLRRDGAPAVERVVVAKSVGWGWLGYHAVLASLRLAEFVPPLVGFRHGLLFSEWVGPPDGSARRPTPAQITPLVAAYVAARVKRLRLDEDPSFASRGARHAGPDILLRTLRQPCGRVLGPLFTPWLRAQLEQYRTSRPSLIDGRMEPDEWVLSNSGIVKVDFEHHNFGGAQPDVVDGCYDLACAIRDLDIAEADEEAILAQVLTPDRRFRRRRAASALQTAEWRRRNADSGVLGRPGEFAQDTGGLESPLQSCARCLEFSDGPALRILRGATGNAAEVVATPVLPRSRWRVRCRVPRAAFPAHDVDRHRSAVAPEGRRLLRRPQYRTKHRAREAILCDVRAPRWHCRVRQRLLRCGARPRDAARR